MQTVRCSSHAQPKQEVVVGIDLGTTNSAIAVRVWRAAWLSCLRMLAPAQMKLHTTGHAGQCATNRAFL